MTITDGVTSTEQREALEALIAQAQRVYVETPYAIIGASGIVEVMSAEEAARDQNAVVNNPRTSVQILIGDSPQTAYRVARATVYGTPEIAIHLVGWFRHERPDIDENVPDGPNLREAINGCMPFIEGLNAGEDHVHALPWMGGSLIRLAYWVIDNVFTPLCIREASQPIDAEKYGSLSGEGLFHMRAKELVEAKQKRRHRNHGGHIM